MGCWLKNLLVIVVYAVRLAISHFRNVPTIPAIRDICFSSTAHVVVSKLALHHNTQAVQVNLVTYYVRLRTLAESPKSLRTLCIQLTQRRIGR